MALALQQDPGGYVAQHRKYRLNFPAEDFLIWQQAGKTRGQHRAQKKAATTNTADLLWSRQANLSGSMAGWSPTQQRHISAKHYIPNRPLELRDSMQSRAYIGQYSHEGNLYVGKDCDRSHESLHRLQEAVQEKF